MIKKQHQLFRHEPHNEIFGDCHRTAIACLLHLNPWEVPHFGQLDATVPGYQWRKEESKFLASKGLYPVSIVFNDLDMMFGFMGGWNPHVYYLLGGVSPRGTDHTVICKGGGFEWDPHPDGGFIVGPCSYYPEGLYEVTFYTPVGLAMS